MVGAPRDCVGQCAGDALALPLADAATDAIITCAFALRAVAIPPFFAEGACCATADGLRC